MREAATAVAVGRRICKEKQGGFVGFKRRVKRTKIKGKGGEGRGGRATVPPFQLAAEGGARRIQSGG